MSLKIYNTQSQKLEEFQPVTPGHVGLYLCGPTVYNLLHVGNFRGPIFFNFVRNYLESTGYKVKFVYNYTDVDDKIIKAAAEAGVTAQELSEKFIAEFEKDFAAVGLRPADVNPRVTTHIAEIISIIESIISHGAGYVVDGEVFCAVEKIQGYGKLSHKNIEDLQAGARVEIGEKKRNPLDFSLWKPAKPGEPSWPSPWGAGRPGWHIECSAMASKHLGETFDIHGGGIDLIFPHHENEIAQSEAANGKPFARYWMHNNFLNMGKEKMSKSLGNIFTCRAFVERYNGEVLKFLMLLSHYRSPMDFTDSTIHHAIQGLARIYSSMSQASKWLQACVQAGITPTAGGLAAGGPGASGAFAEFAAREAKFNAEWNCAAEDDFNTPEIMAVVFNLTRSFNALIKPGLKPSQGLADCARAYLSAVGCIGDLMHLFGRPPQKFLVELDDILLREKGLARPEIQTRVDARNAARAAKDFAKSDALRAELAGLGIELRDSGTGTEWEVKK